MKNLFQSFFILILFFAQASLGISKKEDWLVCNNSTDSKLSLDLHFSSTSFSITIKNGKEEEESEKIETKREHNSYRIIIEIFPLKTLEIQQCKEYWVFLGAPGLGKSTIINALLKKTVAKTGMGSDSDITTNFTPYEDVQNNRVYLDTPGLVAPSITKQAAKEIEKIFKQKARCKIFFVAQLNEARVRAEDVNNINTIMDAINLSHKPFSIIINKLEFDEKEFLEKSKPDQAKVFKYFNCGNNKTNSFCFIDKSNHLKKKKIELLPLSNDVHDFFNTQETIEIHTTEQ